VSDLVSTGIVGLDSVLHGGLPPGRVHLVQGRTGTGKTTLALQFSFAGLRAGERCAYVSFAETEAEIIGIAESHGWSTEGLETFYQGPTGAQRAAAQTVFHPGETELPAILDGVLMRVEALRPSRLVLDSLAELRVLAREPRFYRHELMRLRSRLEAMNCTSLVLDTTVTDEAATLLGSVIDLDRVTPAYGPDRRRISITKMRGHDFESGYHDVRLRTGGLAVHPRLVAAQSRRRFAPAVLPTGLPALDTMLGGGLDEGTAVLLFGPTGTGKSTLALQCAVAAAGRGERVLVFVFDERLQTAFQRARAVGLDLERHVDTGLVTVRQLDPSEVTPGEFADNIRREVEEGGVRLVIIDSLNAYLYAMPEERFLNVHLHELLAYLSQHGVTSILVGAQHGFGGPRSMPGDLDVSYLADTVVLLRIAHSAGHDRKALTVHKRRGGPHEDVTRELRLAADGLAIGDVIPD
jgi:circadian clock protein KaiC